MSSGEHNQGEASATAAATTATVAEPAAVTLPADAPDSAALGAVAETKSPSRVLLFVERFALLVAFIFVLVLFSFWHKTSGAFGTAANYQSLFSHQQVFIAVLAAALLFPLLCGEFDLSVGSIAGFTQIAGAIAMTHHNFSLVEAFILATVFGGIIGAINGNAVARVGVSSLVVTLGTAGILLGVVNWYTHGTSYGVSRASVFSLGSLNTFLGLPRMLILVGLLVVFVWYVINHTPYGRYLMSIGSNPRAARLVGLNVTTIKFSAFVASGALAGFGGMVLLCNTGSANAGSGSIVDTLTALAAVFLGATAIRPGRFNIEGTMIAIMFLAATVSGLELAGATTDINQVFNGGALFVAVIISTVVRKRRLGSGH